MRRRILSLGIGSALVACLVIGGAESATAAALTYTGTLTLRLGNLPSLQTTGGWIVLVNGSAGNSYLNSFLDRCRRPRTVDLLAPGDLQRRHQLGDLNQYGEHER